MRIAQRSIEEVREAANIVEVTSEFTALRRQGARFAGLCPYPDHQEKTPSFSVPRIEAFTTVSAVRGAATPLSS
jgi:DNA primase